MLEHHRVRRRSERAGGVSRHRAARRPPQDDAAPVGAATRAALLAEKALALRTIKELEFDSAMGKVSEADFTEMAGRLRARALRVMQQLEETPER